MKLRNFSVLLFLSIVPSLYAGDFNYSVAAGLGIKGGKTQEYVLKDDTVLSRLDWTDTIITTLTVSGVFDFRNVFIKANVVSALPAQSGIMEDCDFMNTGSEPSHYSQHDLYRGPILEHRNEVCMVRQLEGTLTFSVYHIILPNNEKKSNFDQHQAVDTHICRLYHFWRQPDVHHQPVDRLHHHRNV
ncbi:omptin family outer membrane protease [Breznakiellaceae bacterium SP9]